MDNKKYSIIIPLFNEEEVIEECYSRVSSILDKIDAASEIVFVNDGSKDKTESLVNEICAKDSRVKLVNFSRNFGHQIAITAGMDYCSGDAMVIMDADLQDPPELIPKMINKYKEGFDVVYAIRKKRKGETAFKKLTALAFYKLLKSMANIDIPVNTGDFRLISRPVCEALKLIKEKNRFVRGLVCWVGFKQTGIEYVRDERYAGETKYPLKKMLKFSMDGITSFSPKPLRLANYLGCCFSLLAFIYAIYAILAKILYNRAIQGWTTLIVLISLIGGINMILLGILGEYIARIYDETKDRPLYILKNLVNIKEDKDDK
ncbi:glycosyltransferase family 2 protein [Clostridium felsineum]|uniref:glycosyltransferase family 2 protein n=1 Tax=Clostridium felsineum TaxID=36839 RepID=UPI00098CDE7C|nr:glycosyltransferase family 2 protein [Clostridium felsineum]URZ00150.1 putative glycosyltransferase [Clostridium felsineum]